MTIYNLTASTRNTAARTICIGQGLNYWEDRQWVRIDGISDLALSMSCFNVNRQNRWYLRRLIEGVLPSLPYAGYGDGDIADPKPWRYNYSQDVMKLAKSHKRQEVETTDELLFGIELEFNHSNYSLKDLSPLLGIGIFKHDSSVDGEFVTLPYTYSDMVSKVTALSESFDKLLSANDTLTPLSGVGMHIHLSRKGLSDGQLEIVRGLFDGELAPYISWLCERYPNRFCNYHAYCGSRYVALNEANDNTVEIRAFLSPSNAAGILRNLKLVNAWLELDGMTCDEWEVKYPEFAYNKQVVSKWWGLERRVQQQTVTPPALQPDHGDFDGDLSTRGWEAFDEPSPSCDSELTREAELYEASLDGSERMMPELTPEELAGLAASWEASQAISANEPW